MMQMMNAARHQTALASFSDLLAFQGAGLLAAGQEDVLHQVNDHLRGAGFTPVERLADLGRPDRVARLLSAPDVFGRVRSSLGLDVPASLTPLIGALEADSPREVSRLFRGVALTPAELGPYTMFSEEGYQKTWIATGGVGASSWEIILLGWLPDQATAIHDHGGSEGFDKVIRGELYEESFRLVGENERLQRRGEHRLRPDETSFVDDALIHRISNRGSVAALSLHVYFPAIDGSRVRIFRHFDA